MSLKKFQPEVRFNGAKVDPDEMNRYFHYNVMYPSVGSTFIGTAAAGSSGGTSVGTITNQQLDYPRNLLLTVVNTAGSLNSATLSVAGVDQFGVSQTENIGFTLGTATTAKAGTKIFRSVTAATVTFGTGQVQNGTPYLGVAIGTAVGQVGLFGLPFKIGAASDVKTITWIDNGTSTAITGGTVVSTLVGTANHTFSGTHIIAATDIYTVVAVPTYNSENDPIVA